MINVLRRLFRAWIFVMGITISCSCFANEYENGVAASNRGDFGTALQLWRKLAAEGHAPSQFQVGAMYFLGRVSLAGPFAGQLIPKDRKEAMKWWLLAAEQGYPLAQYYLGAMYDEGEGVPRNIKEAAKWYVLAAKQGNSLAQFKVGLSLDRPGDYNEAVKWYLLSAKQGYQPAQQNLGVKYAKGQGVPPDYGKAYMWLSIAASNGDNDAKRNLASVSRNLSAEELHRAQEKATKCFSSNYKNCGPQ